MNIQDPGFPQASPLSAILYQFYNANLVEVPISEKEAQLPSLTTSIGG